MTNNRILKHRQRERLFRQQQGRCYWCGCQMVMPQHLQHKEHPRNAATIEHLFSRLNPDRGKVTGATHVLACWECNNKRAALEEAALPIEELHKRARRYLSDKLESLAAGQPKAAVEER